MPQTGRTLPDMHESLSRYDVTVTVGCQGGSLPDPAHSLQQPTRRHDTGPLLLSARTWRTRSSAWSRSWRRTGTRPWRRQGRRSRRAQASGPVI